MSETNAADRFIYGSLTGDAQLTAIIGTKVYADIAPQTTPPVALPYVLFSLQAATDLRIVGPYRVWANCLYKIVMVAELNAYTGVLQTGADRIDAVLHAQSGSNIDGTIFVCVRENPFRLTEPPVDGRVFRQLGGLYRILVR